MTPKSLVKIIKDETGIHTGKISEVSVMDSFSFLTVPFKQAEIILNAFSQQKNDGRPHIQRANAPKSKSKKDKKKKGSSH